MLWRRGLLLAFASESYLWKLILHLHYFTKNNAVEISEHVLLLAQS